MDNMVSVERVRIRDIFASFKDIILGAPNQESDKVIEDKLQKVYEVEKEIGASKNIESLVNRVTTYASKATKKRGLAKLTQKDIKSTDIKEQQEMEVEEIEENDLEK